MQVIGKDNPGVYTGGCAAAHPANRNAQYVDLRHQQIRTAVEQVHSKKESSARNPIAAIIRHGGSMPERSEWRNALCFSALRLLNGSPVGGCATLRLPLLAVGGLV